MTADSGDTASAPSYAPSPFSVRNVRLFVAFRVLFNARFYYPVLAVLFIDFGLSAQQYAILNVAWAAAIVLLEVPSGAVADTIGRRNLLRLCGLFMFLEMTLITFVPLFDPAVLFLIFLANRALSGAAEAAASGADEALAYDSLVEAGLERQWSRVLEVLMRWQSVAFVVAMLLGGILYDRNLLNDTFAALGWDFQLSKNVTMRLPLFLVFLESIGVLLVTWRMQELHGRARTRSRKKSGVSSWKAAADSAWRATQTTLNAGRWILNTPRALVIIVFGFVFDSIIRVFLTFNSQYYRVIELPEASFGAIGSALAVVGILLPPLFRKLADHRTPLFNVLVMGALAIAGLSGLPWTVPYWGVLPVIPLMVVMYMTGFLVSNYLNKLTDSAQRATVLSFKGLAFNLAYGLLGAVYAGLLKALHPTVADTRPTLEGPALEDAVFAASLVWWIPYFVVVFLLALAWAAWLLPGRMNGLKKP